MAPAKKPITFKNAVNPLTWNVPIVNKDGSPTTEFQQKWLQQATTNASIVNLTTAAGVSAVLDLITALAGSLLVRGTTRWQGLPSPADATMFLNGAAAPAFAKVKDTDLAVTDVTGNNVSIAAHGFAPKAPNDATKYLDGTGAYSTPPSGGTAAASIYDDGTNIYLALVDADEQLVLDGSGFGVYAPEVLPRAAIPFTLPTYQVFLTGTAATYTPTPGAKWIKVRMVAGGGGGGGSANSSTSNSSNGSDTSFNGVVVTGGKGTTQSAITGGLGGTAGAGTANIRIPGAPGISGLFSAQITQGGIGGFSMLGPGGGIADRAAGLAAPANTGGGGGGGSIDTIGVTGEGGGGGGGGEGAELVLPAASYTYTVGPGGAKSVGNGANGKDGGDGAAGIIIVEEHYL